MIFKWRMIGVEIPASPGAMVRHFGDSGERDAERVGEVLEWLTEHGTVWDMLDQMVRVTIDIEPAPTPPDPDPMWEDWKRAHPGDEPAQGEQP